MIHWEHYVCDCGHVFEAGLGKYGCPDCCGSSGPATPVAPPVDLSGRREGILLKVLSRVHIDPETGCWVWEGHTSGNGRGGGYPRMCLDGQTVAVHRVMFTQAYGYIPGKKQIDHICRNRLCVNPEHLEMVTHKENQRRRDKANGGRSDG